MRLDDRQSYNRRSHREVKRNKQYKYIRAQQRQAAKRNGKK